MMKNYLLFPAMGLATVASLIGCSKPEPTVPTNDSTILHAWSWSFDTIAANMKTIADAGFDIVQTSPANTSFYGEEGGMALYSQPGDSVKGKWYYYYQPVDWKIGNHLLGTRQQFKAMCDSARKYGVRIIVDVLPNHTAVDHTAVHAPLDSAAGGHDRLFHANGFNNITEWNDRYQCTTGMMGGLPDVNTENPGFQHYYLQYVNDLIACGARGFRYDTAKHIGLPDDPRDSLSERNNFWPIATGRESVQGLTLALPADSLFIYGEVLQDKNVREADYAEAIGGVTASNYGHALRKVLHEGNYFADTLSTWHNPAPASKLVTWVESHDTYANEHESADLEDAQVRQGYVFLAARQEGTPLFFSRPAGSTRQNYWGNNRIGARGNDEFFNPEVVAANRFRHAMKGMPETVTASNDGSVIAVARGKKGVAVINISSKPQTIDLATTLPSGTYTDGVHGTKFTSDGKRLTGETAPLASYILYKDAK